MALARFFLFALAVLAAACVIAVESSPVLSDKVVYTRYVRRRPTNYSQNKFMKEVVEVFETKRRPPPHAFLNDEDLVRFVRCDYDPSLPGCEDAGIIRKVKPTSPPTSSSRPPTSSEMPPTMTVTTPAVTTNTEERTTTEKIPTVPDNQDYEEENENARETGNGVEYEDETIEDNEQEGQDDNYLTEDNEAGYGSTYDEPADDEEPAEDEEPTKSDELANEDEPARDQIPADIEGPVNDEENELDVQELTTTKPKKLFGWF